MQVNIVYITASDGDEARKIGKELVSLRLAACVNIIDNISSLYWWDGKIHEDGEAVLIAKTKQSLIPELMEVVKSMHSYSCPCIVTFPIADGNEDFLGWIARETK